ncbi:hypothetical protein [Dongia sedimenti]|uniref:Uncharacterized protein n=1 Tax=Dongia sedimenti TaxID=3064282 RepID=A0ABU0YXA9_9PROT|nr:hypothetical protein [Rhodospirillaceae bacterium R-7]
MADGTTFQAEDRSRTTQNDPSDLIVELYPTFIRLMDAVGNVEPGESEAFERLLADQAYSMEHFILSTPATSLEGATRQMQILMGILDGSSADPDNITDGKRVMQWLAIALCGALQHLVPRFEHISGDHYHTCSAEQAKKYYSSIPAQFHRLAEIGR